jgi:hypothetical protein
MACFNDRDDLGQYSMQCVKSLLKAGADPTISSGKFIPPVLLAKSAQQVEPSN